MTLRTSLRWPERALIILGFLMIGLWFKYDTEARAFRSADRKTFDAVPQVGAFSDAPAVWLAEAPWCPTRLDRGVFGRLEVRRLGISALISEGTDPAQLERTVGHIPTSVFPGRPGNCALAGLGNGFLRGLGDVRKDDVIRIDTLQGTYSYAVEWSRVVGSRPADVFGGTDAPTLTLVAHSPPHAADPAPNGIVVRARLIEFTGQDVR